MSQGLVFFIIFILKCKKKERGRTLSKYPIVAEAGAQSSSPTWVAGTQALEASPGALQHQHGRQLQWEADLGFEPWFSDMEYGCPELCLNCCTQHPRSSLVRKGKDVEGGIVCSK